ncbi:hypothetical protein [Patulibacter defluvii]|uniref:hypothetical protein n=1 Tax=Patulibacter defluvii TaxID=3095358 RepID=UPI002A754A86|nr:hypothetical protein [Patulibacter sp. DM4]
MRVPPMTGPIARLLPAVLTGLALTAPAATAAPAYAPVDRPGPPLRVPAATLDAALSCSGGIDRATRAPVLLVHGTNANATANWSFTYQPALRARGVPWCAVELPDWGTNDIQRNGEYVVRAIRTIHRRAGRRISIIGASQGGMLPRWALRFWPDVRPMVDDLIGLAPSNHGTSVFRDECAAGGCKPAEWQQRDRSAFITALNSGQETFPGISYTNVYTHSDQTVQPNLDDHGSSSLHGGGGRIANVAIQEICPAAFSEHLTTSATDGTAYALAIDALEHDGPASRERVGAHGCNQPPIPNADPLGLILYLPTLLSGAGATGAVASEPPLACYVTASCPGDAPPAAPAPTPTPALRLSVRPRTLVAGRTAPVRIRVRDAAGAPVAGARVRLAGARARSDRHGRALLRVRVARPGRRTARAAKPGWRSATVVVRVRPVARR